MEDDKAKTIKLEEQVLYTMVVEALNIYSKEVVMTKNLVRDKFEEFYLSEEYVQFRHELASELASGFKVITYNDDKTEANKRANQMMQAMVADAINIYSRKVLMAKNLVKDEFEEFYDSEEYLQVRYEELECKLVSRFEKIAYIE